jgi:hypothetical protein
MIRELFVWGKYVTFNYFREKTKIHKRNSRQVARAPPPSPTPFSLPPLYIYVTQWMCTAVLVGLDPAIPPPPLIPPLWDSYSRALLVSQDRRHLFLTQCPPLSRAAVCHVTPAVRTLLASFPSSFIRWKRNVAVPGLPARSAGKVEGGPSSGPPPLQDSKG